MDNIDLEFTDDGIDTIASLAEEMNLTSEDIGARRLHSIMEHIIEEVSFDIGEEGKARTVVINSEFVTNNIVKESASAHLKKYIL